MDDIIVPQRPSPEFPLIKLVEWDSLRLQTVSVADQTIPQKTTLLVMELDPTLDTGANLRCYTQHSGKVPGVLVATQ